MQRVLFRLKKGVLRLKNYLILGQIAKSTSTKGVVTPLGVLLQSTSINLLPLSSNNLSRNGFFAMQSTILYLCDWATLSIWLLQ